MAVPMYNIRVGSLSDTGKLRDNNEDALLVINPFPATPQIPIDPAGLALSGCFVAVADGMGGTEAGEVAANQAVQALTNYFAETSLTELTDEVVHMHLERCIYYTQVRLIQQIRRQPHLRGMGTTLVVAWVFPHRAYVAWVGDSRCYRMTSSGQLTRQTDDHSLVWQLVMAGKLTVDEAALHEDRNIITQNLGSERYPPRPDYITIDLKPGDRLLLCSDGLNTMLPDTTIEAVLRRVTSPADACQALVKAANEAGGEDNITTIIVELGKTSGRDTADALLVQNDAENSQNLVWNLLKSIRL